jgi:hypothetical protein
MPATTIKQTGIIFFVPSERASPLKKSFLNRQTIKITRVAKNATPQKMAGKTSSRISDTQA